MWNKFRWKGRYHQGKHYFRDFTTSPTSGFLQSLLILMRLICIISVYLSTVLLQNKKMIQILITWTKKVSEAICLNNWWHCSRIVRLTLKPCCVPDQTRPGLYQGSIQTKWIVEHTGRGQRATSLRRSSVYSYRALFVSTVHTVTDLRQGNVIFLVFQGLVWCM